MKGTKYSSIKKVIFALAFFLIIMSNSFLLFSQEEIKKEPEILKPYKINGVREFHNYIKGFVNSSKDGELEKLSPEIILEKTINLSKVVLMVDNLSDEDYFQVVYNAIISYKEYLFENENFKGKEKVLSEKVITYLDDLEKDLVNQNNENMSSTGTKAFRFDIANFVEDNSSNYDMKQAVLKDGLKAAERYIPYFNKIDEELINKFNSEGVKILKLDLFTELPSNVSVSLIKFKGKKIFFPSLKTIDNESLKILAEFKNEIEFEKLEVTDKNINVLSTFKASELRIKGLPKKYNKMIKNKLGKRYKRKIKFKKMKK